MMIIIRYILFLLVASMLIIPGHRFTPAALAASAQDTCERPFEPVSTPLNDLAGLEYMRMDGTGTGAYGGLYPNGSNSRPSDHEAAGRMIARQVAPLDANGSPDHQEGRIGMVSVGMSNTAMEFLTFKANSFLEPDVNPKVTLINGAQPGQVSGDWVDPDAAPWKELDNRLQQAGLTPEQVQIVWLKQTQTGHGSFPEKPRALQEELKAIVQNLQERYPNTRLVYLSSRTRSYTYWNGLSPEPSAFETGFAVKWLIQAQIEGDPALNYDPKKGPVKAPYLSWGPYLWADGLNPRSDGLVWTPEDMVRDCTHPSEQGRQVVAQMLLDFFKTDSTTTWFVKTDPIFLPLLIWNIDTPIHIPN
jgi:hypothetical protein